ncbi:hypothetical protein V8F20_007079 [Naviculisporaceae sp. PSN 640]
MASSSHTQPVLRKVDISANPTVLTVATTLRRLWLVDPASPVLAEQLAKLQEEGGHDHAHDHSNCEGHNHDHEDDHAHEADLDKDEHDHANCSGHDHSHDHSHSHEEDSHSEDDESSCGCGHDHDDEDSELHQIFPIALQSIANQIGEAANPNDDAYDDEKWKASTDFVLIEPPAGLSNPFPEDETKYSEKKVSEDQKDEEEHSDEDQDEDETISSPLFTPFRQQVYGIYNHVFYDAYSSLKAELGDDATKELGEFEPPATTVMVLEAPAEDDPEKGIPHEFETDTFVYPIWIAKGTRLVLKEEGKEEEELVRFGNDGKKWTEVFWFRRGTKVVVYPETENEDNGNFKGVVALLALGVCDPVGEAGEGADADVE